MLELICQHAYTWDGVPADRSPYRNHGTAFNTGGAFDGAEPGSGIITFPQVTSRVRIPTGPTTAPEWLSLVALKIEVVARIDALSARRAVLVAGDGSFTFGLLEGALWAEFENGSGYNNFVQSAYAYAPDHQFHAVPLGRWVKLSLLHDGFARMRLFIDDVLVGDTVIQGGVPPVKSGGVSIGNDVYLDRYPFPGQLDDLTIWRLDPHQMKREFLRRPYNPRTAECWREFAERVAAWMKSHPEQVTAILRAYQEVSRPAIRTAYLLPDHEQARLRAILAEFGALWFAGRITGSEMRDVLQRLIAALRAAGIDPRGGTSGQRMIELAARSGFTGDDLLRCDRQIAAFLRHLKHAVETEGRTPEVAS
ncbi:MAG: hypothetical protein IT306_05025 [Chloroflexi bacterium]|nr:hypothetical protein [Chloroflexota bacterium]